MRRNSLCSTHLKMDYFKIILGVILLAFFSIHVYFELRKFFRQDTTLTFTRAEVNQMKFPAVSFCARNPFKTNILTKLGYPVDLWTNIPSGNSTVNLFDFSSGSFLNIQTLEIRNPCTVAISKPFRSRVMSGERQPSRSKSWYHTFPCGEATEQKCSLT